MQLQLRLVVLLGALQALHELLLCNLKLHITLVPRAQEGQQLFPKSLQQGVGGVLPASVLVQPAAKLLRGRFQPLQQLPAAATTKEEQLLIMAVALHLANRLQRSLPLFIDTEQASCPAGPWQGRLLLGEAEAWRDVTAEWLRLIGQ